MRYIILLIILSTGFHTMGQWYKPEKVGKKVANIYSKALENADYGNFTEAIKGMGEAIAADSSFVEGYLSRAGLHAMVKDYSRSVSDFESAFFLDSVFSAEYQLPYSISLAGIGEFEKALVAVNSFLQLPGLNERSRKAALYRKGVYEFAISYKSSLHDDYVFEPVNLGESINSSELEYYPSLTIDGSNMIFTRRLNNADEDFYESTLKGEVWSKAKPLEGKINTDLNEGAQNISQDGQWLVLTACNYPEGHGSCDLYISYASKKGGWTEPKNLGYGINTEFWESSPSLSPDKRDLYFSSNRPGGYGGKDIWVSRRSPDGKWTRPLNLGPDINTEADETCPFIHADNQTLYFNSNGHLGYGAADLFLSRRQSNGTWSEPENLGYPINTIDEEGSLIVASDGITGYFASDRSDTRGGLDIYSFRLRDTVKAFRTLWVKGKVYDKKTNKGLPCTIELTDINNKNLLYQLQTDEEGNYLIPMPEGKDYAFNVNRKGYLIFSENFSMSSKSLDSPLVIYIPLQPFEPGASVVLKNIFFETNKFSLQVASEVELDKIVSLLKDNPGVFIQIIGHTDNVGKESENMALSLNRARSVVEYLEAKGIEKNRLSFFGNGSGKPLATNDTEEGRALNRRTELKVVSN